MASLEHKISYFKKLADITYRDTLDKKKKRLWFIPKCKEKLFVAENSRLRKLKDNQWMKNISTFFTSI